MIIIRQAHAFYIYLDKVQSRTLVACVCCVGVGTSLAAVMSTGSGGALSYGLEGHVDWEVHNQ
jgi:uncharacterized membrane protein YfcA